MLAARQYDDDFIIESFIILEYSQFFFAIVLYGQILISGKSLVDHFCYLVMFCLVFFCTNLQHLFITCFNVSYSSRLNLHLLFCYLLSVSIYLLKVTICDIIKRDSTSLFRFPFLCHALAISLLVA